jgi:hypothetical protein
LAERLAALPGLHPQRRSADCTRHAYHLFMLRIDGRQFGAPRPAVVAALRAEGIPCSPRYGFSLPEQPIFRNRCFGPYLAKIKDRLDYAQVHCPHSDLLCREQALWLEHAMLLGPRADMDDIYRAFEKIHADREALNAWAGGERKD